MMNNNRPYLSLNKLDRFEQIFELTGELRGLLSELDELADRFDIAYANKSLDEQGAMDWKEFWCNNVQHECGYCVMRQSIFGVRPEVYIVTDEFGVTVRVPDMPKGMWTEGEDLYCLLDMFPDQAERIVTYWMGGGSEND